jgi:hypothetical protein
MTKNKGWKKHLETLLTAEDSRTEFQDQAFAVVMYAVLRGLDLEQFVLAVRDSWAFADRSVREAESELLKQLGTTPDEILRKIAERGSGSSNPSPDQTAGPKGEGAGVLSRETGVAVATVRVPQVSVIHVDNSSMGGKKREDLN